ncbi:hypothetical protein VM636_14050 [Streptomyces sp. SCSIO 75703]|uniref:hypothetical protein n=1 Tax=unclassified Streptomyces TaxID=2593676 RepID=UPI00131D3088|nr:hypothetical protein [Streptomyces sp. NRRL F-5065]
MSWRDVRAGALSVLDPTGAVFPAHRTGAGPGPGLGERLAAVNAALDTASRLPVAPAEDGTDARQMRDALATLRLVAVTVSFTSAALSAVLAVLALVVDSRWPVVVIVVLSAVTLSSLAAFLCALRHALARRGRRGRALYSELRALAFKRVEELDTAQLMRQSERDHEMARALLFRILTEYEEASAARGAPGTLRPVPTPHTARRLMRSASPTHPVRQALHMMVADLQEKSA